MRTPTALAVTTVTPIGIVSVLWAAAGGRLTQI